MNGNRLEWASQESWAFAERGGIAPVEAKEDLPADIGQLIGRIIRHPDTPKLAWVNAVSFVQYNCLDLACDVVELQWGVDYALKTAWENLDVTSWEAVSKFLKLRDDAQAVLVALRLVDEALRYQYPMLRAEVFNAHKALEDRLEWLDEEVAPFLPMLLMTIAHDRSLNPDVRALLPFVLPDNDPAGEEAKGGRLVTPWWLMLLHPGVIAGHRCPTDVN